MVRRSLKKPSSYYHCSIDVVIVLYFYINEVISFPSQNILLHPPSNLYNMVINRYA
jgi:hypothetical protein